MGEEGEGCDGGTVRPPWHRALHKYAGLWLSVCEALSHAQLCASAVAPAPESRGDVGGAEQPSLCQAPAGQR